MADKSKIEWTATVNPDGTVTPGATWTPIRARRRDTGKVGVHCERVSPACTNCYAAALNRRNLPNHGTGLDFTVPNREMVDIFVDEKMLMAPLRWKRPRKIFVCSQTDLFADFVDDEQIAMVFAVMALAHWHTHQVLTKRPDRMLKLLLSVDFWELVDAMMTIIVDGEVDPLERMRDDLRATAPEVSPDVPLPNVWLGVTAENQEWADKRIPVLLETPAARRFVSVEPMLGPINLRNIAVDLSGLIRESVDRRRRAGETVTDASIANYPPAMWLDGLTGANAASEEYPGLDWVICGGESGPGARPMHRDWARSLRDQCQAAGVPFFFKQRGEYCWDQVDPGSEEESEATEYVNLDGKRGSGWVLESDSETISNYCGAAPQDNCVWVRRVGKRAAGRLLDGREWNEFPEVRNA